jgi:hypothetical protein
MIEFSCPGCGKSFQVDERLAGRRSRCKRCGKVTRIPAAPLPFMLASQRRAAAPEISKRRTTRVRQPRAIGRDAWTSLAIGSGLAAVALAVPMIGFVPDVLITVIHELGHVATAWLFGSPALPSFDLTYGGGVSVLCIACFLVLLIPHFSRKFTAFPTDHLLVLGVKRPWLRSHLRQRLVQLDGSFSFCRTPKSWSPVA